MAGRQCPAADVTSAAREPLTAGQAVIASEAQARPGGYFWWHGGCYYRYPNGAWSQPLYPSYCGY